MKNEVNPAVFWVLIGVVAVIVVVFGFRMFSSGQKVDTTGSEATMKRYQETGKFYEPPAGAPVPKGPGGQPAMPGGYNMTPPPGR